MLRFPEDMKNQKIERPIFPRKSAIPIGKMVDTPNKAPDLELEKFRPYLVLLARMNLGPALQGKFDASDMVQLTLLEAHRKRGQFQGQDEAAMAVWLRQLLVCTILDARREFATMAPPSLSDSPAYSSL